MVPTLGERFPPEFQAAHRERSLRPGAVFRVHVNTTNPPKIKRIVVLSINQGNALVGHLFINSDINLFHLDTDELRNLQIFLESQTRDYLSHDSYLDCAQLYSLPLGELQALYAADPSILLGHLPETDLANAIEKVVNARTISNKIKRQCGLID